MSFIASYKHLEKLCGDMLNDRHGVSAYIDEMLNKPRGTYHVGGWDNDLKQLKHYRWVRNQIVHEPSCTEDNMCHPKDVDWLNDLLDRKKYRGKQSGGWYFYFLRCLPYCFS